MIKCQAVGADLTYLSELIVASETGGMFETSPDPRDRETTADLRHLAGNEFFRRELSMDNFGNKEHSDEGKNN